MCASRAAQFLLQMGSFSFRDAHAFNRYSSSQVTLCVCCSRFPLVSIGFSSASSLQFPSFHDSPVLVVFRFVADNSLARFVWNLSDAPIAVHLTAKQDEAAKGHVPVTGCVSNCARLGVQASLPGNRSRRSKESKHVFLTRSGPNIETLEPAYRAVSELLP